MPLDLKALTPQAQIKIIELHAEYRRKAAFADWAVAPSGYFGKLADEYEAKLKAIILDGMQSVSADRNIVVTCPACGNEETVPGDVPRWTCKCAPHIELYTFQTWRISA